MISILALIFSVIAMGTALYTANRNKQAQDSTHVQGSSNSIVLDSNILIDGRMLAILEAGMLGTALIIIPQFVLDELQLLADGRDSFKRERARNGLRHAALLSEQENVTINDQITSEPVDKALIALCLSTHSSLSTTDYALELLAQSRGIVTINPNNLADMLKLPVASGETFTVQLIKHGDLPRQGVGYLEDSTLVVVNGVSKKDFLAPIQVQCEKTFQTKSGKMVFARKTNP